MERAPPEEEATEGGRPRSAAGVVAGTVAAGVGMLAGATLGVAEAVGLRQRWAGGAVSWGGRGGQAGGCVWPLAGAACVSAGRASKHSKKRRRDAIAEGGVAVA